MTVAEVPVFAAAIEAAGAGGLWYGEAYGRESMAQAGLVLSGTSDLIVGSSIASIHGRDAMALRGAQGTANAVHGGRFVLGLGVSHAPLVERMRGHHYGKPLTAMREYLDALDGSTPLAIDLAPAAPRMLAALGPRMLELAAERTEGALPYLTLPSHTAEARSILGDDAVLVVEQACVVADVAPDVARERARAHLEVYTGLPNYRNSWQRQGFGEQDWVRGGSPRLQDALVTVGLDAALDRIREHLDAGADQVAVQILGESLVDGALADVQMLLQLVASAGARP